MIRVEKDDVFQLAPDTLGMYFSPLQQSPSRSAADLVLSDANFGSNNLEQELSSAALGASVDL